MSAEVSEKNRVKIGCCASADRADAVKRAGFDFIEPPAAATLRPDADGEEFAPSLSILENLPIPAEAFNIFLPGDLKITGPVIDWERIRRYLRRVMDRASAIGGKVIVMGSAGSRNAPEGFDLDEAESQIVQFLSEAAPFAERYGITLVVEPLNQGESNVINSVPEAVRIAQAVDRPGIRALADLYHIVVESEPLDHILESNGMLAHVHVADTGRFAPGTGEYDTIGFFRRLKAIGYAGRISVECTWKDFDAEAPSAIDYLRKTWDAA